MNSIYLRRRCKVYVKEGDAKLPLSHVAALQKNIECLGFACSKELLDRLQTFTMEKLGTFYRSLIQDLRHMVGAHRAFKPMYPSFPEQVMEMSEARLYLNAFLHYVTNLLPNYDKDPRSALLDVTKLRVIELGSREDFENIFTRLAGSRTSLSPEDKQDMGWFVAQYRDEIARLLPAEVPLKENVAVLGASLLRCTSLAGSFLGERLKTATDVLRLSVALSDGDVSLAEPTKFTKFKRSERKWLLSRLEQTCDPTEDMLRWPEPWKRLGERLHPGDYATQFPKTYAAFGVIRNQLPYLTFNGKMEKRLLARDISGILAVVGSRPGDLTRRLDHLLRLADDRTAIIESFHEAADKVSTPVLLQALTHFRNRGRGQQLRSFFPKGDLAKVYATPNRLPALSPGTAETVAGICEKALVARFSKLPGLGACYLDPELVNYFVPFSQRSASKALRTLVRGSRLPMPSSNVVRFFVWWKNGTSRTDIDLSAALYDTNFKYVDVVSYYNLKNFGGHHSGDIVDAPQGAAEFIDLNIERTVAANVRYVVMSLNSFTEQPYCDLPECFAGWMARQHANSGEIFEPRTVQDKVDVATNTRIALPAILDLVERKVIWADIALRKHASWNNVQNNLSGVSVMARALTSLVKTDLHTLFSLHINARGELVSEQHKASCVFSVGTGITPFDLSRIASEFL
ncbi:MAG TPA: TerD family protein [Candidatus Saccharimonadales bacterium]|nr:TerD family protein [Candidatus Saccharimonadales bacterium]